MKSTDSEATHYEQLAGVLAASVALMGLALVYAEFDLATLLCAVMTLITGVLMSIFAVASTGWRRWVTLSVLAVYLLGSVFLLTHEKCRRHQERQSSSPRMPLIANEHATSTVLRVTTADFIRASAEGLQGTTLFFNQTICT